jgi:hypothetical protein
MCRIFDFLVLKKVLKEKKEWGDDGCGLEEDVIASL